MKYQQRIIGLQSTEWQDVPAETVMGVVGYLPKVGTTCGETNLSMFAPKRFFRCIEEEIKCESNPPTPAKVGATPVPQRFGVVPYNRSAGSL